MKSLVWGNVDFPITQDFGVNLPAIDDSAYAYAADWGLPYGSHVGLDVAMPAGTPVYALTDGYVSHAGPSRWFRPNPVHILVDSDGQPGKYAEEHIYGHLRETFVRPRERVVKGQLIGLSGEQTREGTNIPDGTGPHLHFERRSLVMHSALDPKTVLDATGDVFGEPPANDGSEGTAASGLLDMLRRAGCASVVAFFMLVVTLLMSV